MDSESVHRRFPRRTFRNGIGLLELGTYTVIQGFEIGEGGLLYVGHSTVPVGGCVVLNFFIPGRSFVTVTGEILYHRDYKNQPATGVKFRNLAFEVRRMIRDYIAEKKTSED